MPSIQSTTTAPPPATTSFRPLLLINLNPFSTLHIPSRSRTPLPYSFAVRKKSDSEPDPDAKLKTRRRRSNTEEPRNEGQDPSTVFPTTIRRRPRRGRRSEAVAVEDFVRDRLEKTFASIRQQNPDVLDKFGNVMKERAHKNSDSENDGEEQEEEEENDYEKKGRGRGRRNTKMVVEEESSSWPLDADVGWGIRASEYFEKHSINNVVGEDGVEIDWEGEVEDSWVKEINCLEWESFAFHPSPLIVLVFERYNKATDNWKTLKELEKAAKVYWSAKDRLPPRMVKFDVNIEKDMTYALKVKECPQILFLRGHRIMYREKEFRTADELVQMIAHFYYNAKKPLCMKDAD